MKSARITYALLAVAGLMSPTSAIGQRIYPPSPDTSAATSAGAGTVTVPAPTPSASGGWVPAGTSPYGGAPSASVPAAGASPYAPSGGMTYGSVAPPGGYGSIPTPGAAGPGLGATPAATPFGAPPSATFSGTIQPLGPNFDPYGSPVPAPAPLMPNDPYLPSQYGQFPNEMFTTMQRFRQSTAMDYHWFAGSGTKDNELGINDVEITSTFTIPFYSPASPLLITPGFAFHFWDGPRSIAPPGGVPPDLPPETYDAFLDTAWNPQITPWFGAELDFLIGVFSDFRKVNMDSLRFKGRGMGVIRFSDAFKIKVGVWYLDRVRVKLLPAGGIVWSPNPETRFDILFPNPRFTQKLGITGTTEWWWYLAGEYGGGVWSVRRDVGPPPPDGPQGTIDLVDYNDLRVALGLEFKRLGGLTGWFESGFSFERELRYRSRQPEVFYLNSTVFLRAGVAF